MERNKIIEQLARRHFVERYIHGFHPDREIRAELAQEVYLVLLEYKAAVIEEADKKGKLHFLVFKIARNLFFSSTSTFYHKCMRYENNRRTLQFCEGESADD